MATDDNDQESIRIRAVLKITNKRAFENGFIVETDASMGNPCETVQVHTFSKSGKHLQMEEFVLGCLPDFFPRNCYCLEIVIVGKSSK